MAKKTNPDFFDISSLFKTYMSKWYYFAISVVVCCGLGFVYTKMKQPVYEVRANVLIGNDDDTMPGMGQLGSLFSSQGPVDDELFIISSHTVYRDVVKSLRINKHHTVKTGILSRKFAYPLFPIDVYMAPGVADTLSATIVFKAEIDKKGKASVEAKVRREVIGEVEDAPLPVTLETSYGRFVIDTTACYPKGEGLKTTIAVTGYDAAAENLAEDIVAEVYSKKSNVINLGMQTTNSGYGQDVLNQVMTQYNDRGVAQRNTQGEKTAEFIDKRLALISGDLDEAESDIQKYKQQQGIVDVAAEAQYQTRRRGALEENLLAVELQHEIVKLTLDFLSDRENDYNLIPVPGGNDTPPEGVGSYNALIFKRMQLLESAKPNNQAVKQLDKQIDAMRENIIASAQKTYENLSSQVKELRAEMNRTSSKLGSIPTQEREYLNMKRQQEVKQQLYLFLLQRREETAMLLANAVPKGVIVDEAYTLNEPVGLGKKAILLIAFLLGLIIPPVFIYMTKKLRNRFESSAEAEEFVDMPLLGEVTTDRSGETLVVTPTAKTTNAELFRLMRTNLLFILNDVNDKVILVTSTKSGEGKSFVSINLCASLSLLEKRVLLIGMDIRKPRLAQYLGINPQFGLTQYLSSDRISIDQIITPVAGPAGFDVIVAGPVPPNPAELLASKKLDDLLAELRGRYDYILIDSAPVGMVSDSFTLNRLADATVYVCRAGFTAISDLRFANDVYQEGRLKKMSLVVNGTKTKKGYGYGYGEKEDMK